MKPVYIQGTGNVSPLIASDCVLTVQKKPKDKDLLVCETQTKAEELLKHTTSIVCRLGRLNLTTI